MGMAASQARLLSITMRLTSNEFQSQMISNSKTRLANETQAASEEYMEALNATKFEYIYYDANGKQTSYNLTANTIYTYQSLKNQYGIVDKSGRLVVTALDGTNFAESTTKSEFLQKYGIPMTDNPAYERHLKDIYGDNYEDWFDKNNVEEWYGKTNGAIEPNFSNMGSQDWDTLTEAEWNNLVNEHNNNLNDLKNQFGGKTPEHAYGDWIDKLSDPPDFVEKPPEPVYPPFVPPVKPPYPDLIDEAMGLIAPACWDGTGITGNLRNDKNSNNDTNTWHIEHVLSQYLWSPNSSDTNYASGGTITVTINGKTQTITNDPGIWAMSSGGGNGQDPKNVRGILADPANAELRKNLEVLYYEVCKAIDERNINSGLTSGSITTDGTPAKSSAEIGAEYYDLMLELLTLVAEQDPNFMQNYQDKCDAIDEQYEKDYKAAEDAWKAQCDAIKDAYDEDLKDHNKSVQEIREWIHDCEDAEKIYKDLIDSIPPEEIPDETHEKYEWYSNLWHRMNGDDDEEKNRDEEQSWVIMDDKLVNSQEWLKFALESGEVTLEHVKFIEDPESGTGLENAAWTETVWSSTSDIIEVEDELAITRAEVKYNQAMREIQAKDKEYDNDIKKLDTEHNALQTEYDSIKSVMDKNMERSFKAFS